MPAAFVVLAASALAACAPQAHLASTPAPPESWDLGRSDLAPDPAWHFSTLPNGMRLAIRHNGLPAGMVQIRMRIHAGSLDETEAERGYAHLVEHMAFQGSTHVAPGEMVKLLERDGLAFGADTNAFTSYDNTLYALDLPKNDPALIDTALMLLRETASELSFRADKLEAERGVVLAEKRDRDTWQFREVQERLAFNEPGARFVARMPIGTPEALAAATPEALRAFWQRVYVPGKTTLFVVGDVDPAAVAALVSAHFADWPARPSPAQPSPGPLRLPERPRTDIYLDPALAEHVSASLHGPYQSEPDTAATRQAQLLRRIGYGIVNRRLGRLSRRPDAAFRAASFGTSDVFKVGRHTTLNLDAIDGQWARALTSVAQEYRRAMTEGFTAAEVAEQLANIRVALQQAAAEANTLPTGALMREGLGFAADAIIPTTPTDDLARFTAFAPAITPTMVLAALRSEALPLDAPILRFQGRRAPVGGARALRSVWQAAMRAPLPPALATSDAPFAYTDFGPPGTVVADTSEPLLGIREIRFANGLRLNLKHTDLVKDQIGVALALDGGEMLDTKANPLATRMTPYLASGGLGKHSLDALQSLLAGHQAQALLLAQPEAFTLTATTNPADLTLELQLIAALITDPGYRREGEVQYHLAMNNAFAQMRASPGGALGASIGAIVSDNDPRFSLQPQAAYQALTFARLKAAISDRLAHGAIEIGVVGDIDEAATIRAVGATLGALPPREAAFQPYADQRQRPFTPRRGLRIVTHQGPADQALVQFVWPTRDDTDPEAKQVLNLLARITQLEITEALREKLGKAYSPGVGSNLERAWKGYGTFTISASVNVGDVAAVSAAIRATVAGLRAHPVSDDLMLRARAPMLESYDNALKTNAGWLALTARAQSQADRIERHIHAGARLSAVSAGAVAEAARRYLTDEGALEIHVLPEKPAPKAPQ